MPRPPPWAAATGAAAPVVPPPAEAEPLAATLPPPDGAALPPTGVAPGTVGTVAPPLAPDCGCAPLATAEGDVVPPACTATGWRLGIAVADLAQHRAERLHLALGDARSGLVEQQHARAERHHRPELREPAGARRQLGHMAAGEPAEAEQLDELLGAQLLPSLGRERGRQGEQRGNDLGGLAPLERDLERVEQRHLGEQACLLERAAEPEQGALLRPEPGDVGALDQHPSRVGAQMAGEDVEQRGLARAVGTHEADDLPRLHAHRHTVEDDVAAEAD